MESKTSRRQFFRAVGRFAAFGALGAAVWRVLAGERTGTGADACRDCLSLSYCKRPDARTARSATGTAASANSAPSGTVARQGLCGKDPNGGTTVVWKVREQA